LKEDRLFIEEEDGGVRHLVRVESQPSCLRFARSFGESKPRKEA
jgi:hypothetical protein